MKEIFKNIKQGTFFIYEGWCILKVQELINYNAILFEPENGYDPTMQHIQSALKGTWIMIKDNEEVEIVNLKTHILHIKE